MAGNLVKGREDLSCFRKRGIPEKRDSNSFSQIHFISFFSQLTRSLEMEMIIEGPTVEMGEETKGWLWARLCDLAKISANIYPVYSHRKLPKRELEK